MKSEQKKRPVRIHGEDTSRWCESMGAMGAPPEELDGLIPELAASASKEFIEQMNKPLSDEELKQKADELEVLQARVKRERSPISFTWSERININKEKDDE